MVGIIFDISWVSLSNPIKRYNCWHMKNTFFLLFAPFFFTFSADAQQKKSAPVKQMKIPENVTTSFKGQFAAPSDNQWNKNYSGNYVATFTNADNLKQTAEFSESGAMIKSKITYSSGGLPQNVSSSITGQYPAVKIGEADKIQLPGVAPYYRVKVITADNTTKELLVSEEGTITE